jgi:hypothetical protein
MQIQHFILTVKCLNAIVRTKGSWAIQELSVLHERALTNIIVCCISDLVCTVTVSVQRCKYISTKARHANAAKSAWSEKSPTNVVRFTGEDIFVIVVDFDTRGPPVVPVHVFIAAVAGVAAIGDVSVKVGV